MATHDDVNDSHHDSDPANQPGSDGHVRQPDDRGEQDQARQYAAQGHSPFEGMTGAPPADTYPHTTVVQGEIVEEPADREMGFFDHLEELRWRIIKALIGLAVAATACGIFLDRIMEDVILGPWHHLSAGKELQNLEMMGQITLAIQVALVSGLILGMPFIIWQFWGFIKPGLYEKERKMASWVAIATMLCFLAGVSFAYFMLIPTSLGFTLSFGFKGIANQFTISNYFSFVLGLSLACGLVFEMPMLSYALTRFGILSPAFLRKYRRHSIVVILIVAAIVTPTPDPFNQLLLAVPLYGLYELSIYVSAVTRRKRDAADTDWQQRFGLGGPSSEP